MHGRVALELSLADYVKRRNGVALGAAGSMRNMLRRAFTANTFAGFWRYWNPIWGYYLAKYVMKPLSGVLPQWLATLLTCLVSGLLHDLAVALVRGQLGWLFSCWFLMMGLLVVTSSALKWSLAPQHPLQRVCCHLMSLGISFYLARWLSSTAF